jgi:hypothetical protein
MGASAVKIVLDIEYNTDMIDLDLRHLGEVYQHLDSLPGEGQA